MSPNIATPSPQLVDLAAILAAGYLRLTQNAHNLGTSGLNTPQKELEVSSPESAPVHADSNHGRHGCRRT